jgi:TetR/AcrR family transcriptional regulator, transcriptional repressor for nem operon
VARPREFDEEEALDRAMKVFWSKGYASTSLDDLLKSTGIARQSLYGAFRDKHSLFLRALERYLDKNARPLRSVLEDAPSVAQALRAVFSAIAEDAAAAKQRGCMLVNAITELVPGDREVSRLVQENHRFLLATFRMGLERAAKAGELEAGADVDELAHYLVAAHQGLRVVARVDQSRAHLRAIVKSALYFLK